MEVQKIMPNLEETSSIIQKMDIQWYTLLIHASATWVHLSPLCRGASTMESKHPCSSANSDIPPSKTRMNNNLFAYLYFQFQVSTM